MRVSIAYETVMESLGSRIRIARKSAGLTQRQIADHFQMSRPSVSQWESDDSRPDQDKLPDLAKLLSVGMDWLLEGRGKPPTIAPAKELPPPARVRAYRPGETMSMGTVELSGTRTLPVFAATQGGTGHMIVSVEVVEYTQRPPDLEGVPEAYAIRITGDSMAKAYRDGDIALVHPRLQPARDEVHVFYDHDPRTGEAESIIKNLLTWSDRRWKVEQFNPAEVLELNRADWRIAHRVVGKYNRR